MKNERTPRTLADASFTTGYPQSRFEQAKEGARYVLFAVCLIGVIFGGSLLAEVVR